ncbi:DEAD/DEAH box helicase [Paracoccus sp. MBLB3053]|uniref:DEAD/DEAH box helicase n=1 Tax=Paracoccus aurantius TaxID=3073814 RepID=A0ABU2HU34_9RHOB|nr:DEAD/DEAH box helicase [Paracoccus sp. MBLB3053]MDS9468565.1 DEAD/DEAH box helicase [Paracoccus sp. MBLB3053]
MTKFSDLKLDPKVLKAVTEAGYETPTPIQAGAIPPALEGRDVLGIAQTGTGKTASFTLPMITLLGRGRARARMPRSLVLCPTRELAAQVAENFDIYAKHTRLTKALLIGGVSFGEQDKLIDRGVDVLIATPGRLLDHFERGKLLLTGVQIMVVDEADRMLDMGFIPDIERIFQLTPFTRQTLFFSATMAPEIERITDTFLHAPERIEVARQATTSETITQKLVEITPTRRDQSAKQKRELLRALIRAEGEDLKNAIIFCNRKTDVDIVAKSLKAHGFDAAPIHGDLDQRHRMATLDDFRDGKLRFLIASDVAARGLDIPSVSHVFNFDLPSHAEDYVHRIGRTGRAGRLGTAISISTPADEKYLTAIEALVKQALPRAETPEGFSLSAAAQSAPRPSRESGRRERGRDRRGRRDDSEQRSAKAEETKPVEPRAREERKDERREAPREERREERRDDRRERHDRQDRRDDRGTDRRTERHTVMGMGDHVPEFMTRSFRPTLFEVSEETATQKPKAEPTAAPVAKKEAKAEAKRETVAETVVSEPAVTETPTEAPAKPKRSRSRKSAPKAAPAAAAEAQPEIVAAEAAAVQAEPGEAPVADAPPSETATEAPVEAPKAKTTRARKPRATKAKPVAEAAPAEPVAETPAAAEPAADAGEAKAAEAPTDEAAKPKRKASPRKAAAPKATPSKTKGTASKKTTARAPRTRKAKATGNEAETGASEAPTNIADDSAAEA